MKGHWIKKYPDTVGRFWVTLSWETTTEATLVNVFQGANSLVVSGASSFLYEDDILATWSEPVVSPSIFKE